MRKDSRFFFIHASSFQRTLGVKESVAWPVKPTAKIYMIQRLRQAVSKGRIESPVIGYPLTCGSPRITGSWIPRAPTKGLWWHLNVGSSIISLPSDEPWVREWRTLTACLTFQDSFLYRRSYHNNRKCSRIVFMPVHTITTGMRF